MGCGRSKVASSPEALRRQQQHPKAGEQDIELNHHHVITNNQRATSYTNRYGGKADNNSNSTVGGARGGTTTNSNIGSASGKLSTAGHHNQQHTSSNKPSNGEMKVGSSPPAPTSGGVPKQLHGHGQGVHHGGATALGAVSNRPSTGSITKVSPGNAGTAGTELVTGHTHTTPSPTHLDKDALQKKGSKDGAEIIPQTKKPALSQSQADFFKMLDDKIAAGNDYEPSEDGTMTARSRKL